MKRLATLAAVTAAGAGVAAVIPPYDIEVGTAFRTPDHAAYCDLGAGSFFCFRPRDGFFIRLGHLWGKQPTFTKGFGDRYRGYRNRRLRLIRFGKTWYSSDAEVMTCWSRRGGLTCKHYDSGLTFWIGRRGGYRIYVQPPGRAPTVRPFFRTPFGAYCGLSLDNLEPSVPVLLCWTPSDGLLLSLVHSLSHPRAGYVHEEHVEGLRPPGYSLLPAGRVFAWRCRSVTSGLAERCSTRRGTAVFTCSSRVGGLTCRNRYKHGFWVGRKRNFSVF